MSFRLVAVIALSLLPWPAVWFGMSVLKSFLWTFFLYHGVCLLPAILMGWKLWRNDVSWPNKKTWLLLVLGIVLVNALAVALYSCLGNVILDKKNVLSQLTNMGYRPDMLVPLGLYMVLVNPTLEELFWRGVVLNLLDKHAANSKHFALIWSSIAFASWHYLVFRVLLRPIWAELSIVVLIFIGVSQVLLYRRTKSIIVPIIWHALALDLAVMIVFISLTS
jgi:hypothetical protein